MRSAARVFTVAISCAALSALAQDKSTYNGNWKVVGAAPGASPFTVELTVEGEGGTWQALVTNREDPCVGKKAPIAVLSATPEELTFRIKLSEALPGCPDSTAKFKRVDENTLRGKRGKQEFAATRQ